MKVEFDSHGVTQDCPKSSEQLSDSCLSCPFCNGSEGFVVDCCYGEWEEFEALAERAALEDALVA